ncbi:MAG: tetratricopeptide repeat protein [Verrucomicrobia bacterium]|nr:tetratricopeptide repeat protein [Verrucomicrobiota bacterium]
MLLPTSVSAQNDAGDYSKRAQNELLEENYDGAIADCDKAIQLDPNNAGPYKIRAEAKDGKGDYDGAIADCNQAIQLDPKSASAYDGRASAEFFKGDFDGAIADWDKAIELEPKNEVLYASRGLCKRRQGRYNEAIADFGQAIQLAPMESFLYFERGWSRVYQGQYEEAITDFDQAIDIEVKQSGPVVGYADRGTAKQLKGDFDGAIADFSKAIQFEPASVEPRIDLWVMRIRQGRTAAADQELSRFLDENHYPKPDDWSLKIASFLANRIAEADFLAAVPASGILQNARNCQFWYYAGLKHLSTGDRQKASEYLSKCLATPLFDVVEYDLAEAELKAVGSN